MDKPVLGPNILAYISRLWNLKDPDGVWIELIGKKATSKTN
jgi:hypothetical protein